MKKIEQVTRPIGKKCDCPEKGDLVETFKKVYGKSNGICGPGHFTPSHIKSVSISCEICHRMYALPSLLTKGSKLEKELNFELSLYTGILKRAITIDDIPEIYYYETEEMEPFEFQGNTYPRSVHTPAKKKPESVAIELEKLTIGTTVYYTPLEQGEAYRNPHNPFGTIQLSKERGEKTFQVKYDCFE